MAKPNSDFTPVIDLLRELGTGPVRARRPLSPLQQGLQIP
jgi:hypothetical protein